MSHAFKDTVGRVGNVIHRNVFLRTNGRLLGKMFGMPVVMLTTVGRKSGKKRNTMLTAPIVDGDKVVLVASWGGDDRHPTWYLNLRDTPDVEARYSGKHLRMKARTASVEEKADLWPRVISSYKGYGGYQTKTKRDIPLVILEPA